MDEATAALDRAGIGWSLTDDGQVLRVDPRRRAEARRLLEGTLLPTVRPPRRPRNPEPVAAQLEDDLNRMLADVVGPGRAYVSASATVDRTRRSAVTDGYGPRRAALDGVAEAATLEGDFANGRRAYRRTRWGVDRRVTARRFATGRIERVSLALVVDRRLGRAAARSLRRTVATAAGVQRRRGDRLVVTRVRLRRPGVEAPPANRVLAALGHPVARDAITHGPWGILLMAMAVFAGRLGRDLRAARAAAYDLGPAHR